MTRFFFHLWSKDQCVLDTKGREFDDLFAAHRHAVQHVRKLVLLYDMDWRGCSIEVSDIAGRSLLSVLFPRLTRSPDSARGGRLAPEIYAR